MQSLDWVEANNKPGMRPIILFKWKNDTHKRPLEHILQYEAGAEVDATELKPTKAIKLSTWYELSHVTSALVI